MTLIIELFRLSCVWSDVIDADSKPLVCAAWKSGVTTVLDCSKDSGERLLPALAAVLKAAVTSQQLNMSRCVLTAYNSECSS